MDSDKQPLASQNVKNIVPLMAISKALIGIIGKNQEAIKNATV